MTLIKSIDTKLRQGLDVTKPNHDKHFVKHMTNTKSIGHKYISEHRDLKLI